MIASAAAPTLRTLLQLGANGPEVRALQEWLNRQQLGPRLNLDGKFGKATMQVLAAYQKRNGLKPDGVVGPRTAAKLGWRFAAAPPRPYTVRMDKPPLPGTTSPVSAIAQVIRAGFERYRELLCAWIAKNAVSEKGRINATNDINNLLFGDLIVGGLDRLIERTRNGESAEALRLDAGLFSLNIAQFNYLALELARRMKQAGWQVRGFVDLIDKAANFDNIGQIALRLLRGEQSAEITATQIRMTFQNALGPY